MAGPRLLEMDQICPTLDEPINKSKACYHTGPENEQGRDQAAPTRAGRQRITAEHAEYAERKPARTLPFAYSAYSAVPLFMPPQPENQRRQRQQIQRNQFHQRRDAKQNS